MSFALKGHWPKEFELQEPEFPPSSLRPGLVRLPSLRLLMSRLIKTDTLLQNGDIPVRLDPSGTVIEKGRRRETREFNGRTFLMETSLAGDIAILRAWKVDKAGNCVFRSVLSFSLVQIGPN